MFPKKRGPYGNRPQFLKSYLAYLSGTPVEPSLQIPHIKLPQREMPHSGQCFNTLRTGDADLRFYVTTVQDG